MWVRVDLEEDASGVGMDLGTVFGATNEGELTCYLAAFGLTVGTFILPAGRLGGLYGHKKIFPSWNNGVWALIAGFSVYYGSILFSVSRGFQGIGPALVVPNGLVIAGHNFQGKKKNYAFAYECDLKAEVSEPTFDFAGTVTGVSGLVLFNFAWNQAAVVGWSVSYTDILLVDGILFFAAFIYVETHVTQYPLVPINSLSEDAVYALSIIARGWASFGIWVFYLWQLIENLWHHSVLSAAAQQCPVAVSGLLVSLTVGYLFSKFHVAYIMAGAMACFVTGQIFLATIPVSQTYWAQTFVALPREHQGIAASLINTVVNYSISLSLGLAGTIVRQTKAGGENVLGSYRNAWYFAVGLDGLGMVVALYFLWISVGKTGPPC
ncbi:hypothetical protein DL98DRAFT_561495 [Cadophora sp. DSE1049]|nr:hypothetical protein DL98DRAFT_561495 [Cadophora sp. DSE1049]